MENIKNLQLNQVQQNNKQINDLIEQILQKRRNQRISIEKDGVLDPDIKTLLLYEVQKCLEIYKLEFPNYTCQGKADVSSREPKKTADCYGGTLGLQITSGMQSFIDVIILPTIKKIGYSIDENGEPLFDETFKNNTEHISNSKIDSFKKYVGSKKDQMDYFALLFAKNGVDLDFIWDALAHEAMHIFGVTGGNVFLKEGTTEELTRELCEKYNIHMSPHAHTQEANFVRKIEMLVGRDNIIDAGMWTENFKKAEFEDLLKNNSKLTYSKLSEMFELLKSNPKELLKEETEKLDEFCRSNPNVEKKLKISVEKYRKCEKENLIYSQIAEMFDSELGMKEGSFYKYIEILEGMYSISQNYKKDVKIYRDIYSLSLEELRENIENGKYKEPKKPNEEMLRKLDTIKTLCRDLSDMNPQMKITSFSDLMIPIDQKIIDRELTTNDEIKDYSEILKKQNEELDFLKLICKKYEIDVKIKSGFEDCMQDNKVRTGIVQDATEYIKGTVLGKDENSKENNKGE